MSRRSVDFLKNWIAGNVTEVDKYGSHDRAKELVVKCVGEAKAAGLTLAEMELEPGDLEAMIYEAMHHAFDG
jgi:D-tyrosyl-tRNA(Tyr) deacylase